MNQNKDPLGYDVYAQTLWARIQTALNKDQGGQPLGDDPLVVGIFGEWGAGKSHLLALIRNFADQELERQRKLRLSDEGFSLTVPVFFQPWKYEHEDHLHVPFVMHVFDALKEAIKRSQTANEHWLQWLETIWNKLLPHLPAGVKLFEKLVVDSLTAGTGSSQMKWGLKAVSWLSGRLPTKAPQRSNLADRYKFSGDGHYYRHIQEALKAVTRPSQHPDLLEGFRLFCNPKINFVIFIDDLDRCLPEKAVQTLELIKTVFNVESFAFVLALDDEVIERGIGHRYKEYKLQDKKPEMPITGFEYLEKIVHLPFRLPALTQEQALGFVRNYEKSIEPDAAKRWFDAPLVVDGTKKSEEAKELGARVPDQTQADLWSLVRTCFDAYVPRKLIRLIELLHQTAAIAQNRGKQLTRIPGGQVDVRVVLALILIQLFQPELYRLMRRRTDTFPFLLAAFARGKLKNAHVSDIDLLAWAVERKRRAIDNLYDLPKPPHSLDEAVQAIADLDADQRADAQQVRLPLVTQLIEHRAVQRHVFDVLKLFSELARSMGNPASSLTIAPYFSLLGQESALAVTKRGVQTQDGRPRHNVQDVQKLFKDWGSDDEAVVANIASRNDIPEGHVLSASSVQGLLAIASSEKEAKQQQLLSGLQYLSPYIAQDDGAQFWALVEPLGRQLLPDLNKANTITPDPVKASLYLDVRSMLGQDPRFDRDEKTGPSGQVFKPLYLLKDRWNGNTAMQEPIPGFVSIPAGTYPVGDPEVDSDNPKDSYILSHDIYIARTPVTVDQFSAFITDGGYGENEHDSKAKSYWDDQGWAWRHDSNIPTRELPLNKILREQQYRRNGNLRTQPLDWGKQQRIGSRALTGITWFEARAYARWLDDQFRQRRLFAGRLTNYVVSLPNEWHWELAACGPWRKRWPWGDSVADAGNRANIRISSIDHASVPGCFAPNTAGLLDLAGNVLEFQDGLFAKAERLLQKKPIGEDSHSDESLVTKIQTVHESEYQTLLKTYKHMLTTDWETTDTVALRGGSWLNHAQDAACSSRNGNMADICGYDLGFRVMLTPEKINN